MRFSSVFAIATVAATVAVATVVSATDIFYGNRGFNPQNYGICANAKSTPTAIVSIETAAADFQCYTGGAGGAGGIDCYGIEGFAEACPGLATRCRAADDVESSVQLNTFLRAVAGAHLDHIVL
ncbi:hypothetical protein GQ42DRAFT_177159 [Ramicandelaber brevisporus]|nr:hypothetical protein GQ42DRAFT_177159 [Ramicandelaber brevisporus]